MPKLQAGCTLTANDGMVVKTAQTSQLAADGQNSTLEFILVNHPLDCPVCDKGGECPLQDLTFRWGPPVTRNTFPKRTFEKPIPISPTIALDRERCILCYRCTRFSSDVAEDDQLVARDRGSQSVIATFEDEPYRAPFSGNVIELCPVGALTSTQYRFEARPWEIQDVPTVCGCARSAATSRRRRARARSSGSARATTRRSTRAGSATRAASGSRTCAPATASSIRAARSASAATRRSRGTPRSTRPRSCSAQPGRTSSRRSPARRRSSRPTRSASSCARGSAPTARSCPRTSAPRSTRSALPLSAIRDAELIVDPRRRPRRRAGSDRRPLDQGRAPRGRRGRRERDRRARTEASRRVRDELGERIRIDRAHDPHLVGPERKRRRDDRRRSPPSSASPGSRAAARSTSPRRRTAAASPTAGQRPPTATRPIRSRSSS